MEEDCQEDCSFQSVSQQSEVFLYILQSDDALKTTMKPLYSEPVCVLSIRQQDPLTS